MTKRNPVSAQQNIWFDAQQVDDSDLQLEQQYNDTIQSGIINNHIGTGVLPDTLVTNVIFNSALFSGFLDGIAVSVQNQPSDTNYGNQLEIELTGSKAAGNRKVKLAIIGLDFNNALQYETFVFPVNEIQVSKKHFAKILVLLFNDFIGDANYSFNLGGKIVIREASPLTLSRSSVMSEQSVEPNLFFRDFFVSPPMTLNGLLQSALPYYNVDSLNIFTAPKDNKALLANDVSTQIGQKFLATTNNIQKATLLLSVQNLSDPGNLNWTGDLVVSIYPLQSNINCVTDIAPNLPVDFPPAAIPLAQISFNYNTLLDTGIILDGVPQPVDFVFSNSAVATGNSISAGKYYAITVKRSGAADTCDILLANGSNRTDDSRITTFTGVVWADIPEEDLWYKIYTDAAKVTDGQIYDTGHGAFVPKVIQDSVTLSYKDNVLDNIAFKGSDLYKAVVSAVEVESTPIPDQKTGNPVNSRQQNSVDVKLLNTLDLTSLEKTSDPLVVGAITDKNKKFFDATTAIINSKLYSATMVGDELLVRIVDDPTDTVRFDTSVVTLMSNLLNGDFVNAKLYPDIGSTNLYYRIAGAKLCSMIVGDVNGDGIVDDKDLSLLDTYLGYDLNVGLPITTTITVIDVSHVSAINGYTTLTKPFANASTISFKLVDPATNLILASGTDGVLVANPSDPRLAQFASSSVNFSSFTGISAYKLLIDTSTVINNYGEFEISGIDTVSDVLTLRKVLLNSESILQMLRADIDGDFRITSNDGYLLTNYIDRVPTLVTSTPYSAPTTNPYTKIGTRFNVLRFKLEPFIDRDDDYTTLSSGRSTGLHTQPDVFLNDGYFAGHNFYNSPSLLKFEKQFSWEEYLLVTNNRTKLVPSVITSQTGFNKADCTLPTILCNTFNDKPSFDNGTVDYYVPDNIILGGELHKPNGDYYKVDFEIGTIVLEIPDGLYGTEKTINILNDFISSYTDGSGNLTGITRLGFPAMKFADCSYVTSDALIRDQIRFSVAVQSFSPNTNGLSDDGYAGAIVDGKMGVSVDYNTGMITLNFTNLYEDSVLSTLSTKIQVTVFLKKAGFNNQPLFVDSVKMQNMLKLISVFSGAGGAPPGAPSLNQPLYIYAAAGVFSEAAGAPTVIGAFPYSSSNYIATGVTSIKLETLLETTGLDKVIIQLYDVTASAYVNINTGVTPTEISSISNSPQLVQSIDIRSTLTSGHIYEVHLKTSNIASTAICKMARLTINYF